MPLRIADPAGNKPKAKSGLSIEGALNIMRNGPDANTKKPAAPRTIVTAPQMQSDRAWSGVQGPVAAADPGPVGPSPEQIAAQAAAAAQAKANAEGKAASRKQNDATRDLVTGQRKLIDAFGIQRDTKLKNIQESLDRSQQLLLKNYKATMGQLNTALENNDKSESDATFKNVTNAVRERGELLAQAASNGAGETDLIKSQLQALRNYSSNQSDVSRSFYDTLASVNSSITGLNADTATSRNNLFNQSEADKEAAWANFQNQAADTWTQIANIENSNTNIDSDSSEGYQKVYANAADQAAAAVRGSYKKNRMSTKDWETWDGKGKTADRSLTTSNKAASINLGGPMKTPEGATLRKW